MVLLCYQNKRGFSLIETAIVLGIIGLVIGGVWVAAASVQTSYTRTKYYEGWGQMVSNAQEQLSQALACNTSIFSWNDRTSGMASYIWPTQWEGWGSHQFRRATGAAQNLIDMGGYIHCDSNDVRYLAVSFYDYTYTACRELVTRYGLPDNVPGANVCTGAAQGHTIYIALPRGA